MRIIMTRACRTTLLLLTITILIIMGLPSEELEGMQTALDRFRV